MIFDGSQAIRVWPGPSADGLGPRMAPNKASESAVGQRRVLMIGAVGEPWERVSAMLQTKYLELPVPLLVVADSQ